MTSQLIAICIPTYQRPTLLEKNLLAINKIIRPANTDVIIIIADNDETQDHNKQRKLLENKTQLPLHYCVETKRGLSFVRNRLIMEAINVKADYIAFIDDDEYPETGWLLQLYGALSQFNADVCSGPVQPIGDNSYGLTAQIRKTGTVPRHVSTNNVMMGKKLFIEQELRFDPFFNFIGGEDFDFFDRSSNLGNKHIWTQEALVYEWVTDDRSSLSYIFYRHFTGGINNVLRYRRTSPEWATWLRYMPRIAGKLITGLVYFFLAIITASKPNMAKSIKKIASGIGYLSALLNIVFKRY